MNFHPVADNQQARGGRSRKELADVGPGKLLLLFSCSAVPDGRSHPACCTLVYHSRHCLAVQEGGRGKCQGWQVVRLCTGKLCCWFSQLTDCRGLSLRLNLNTSPAQEHPQHPDRNEWKKKTHHASKPSPLSWFCLGRSHVLTASTHMPNSF